jgi:hypothetical protein
MAKIKRERNFRERFGEVEYASDGISRKKPGEQCAQDWRTSKNRRESGIF